ncbi:MAG: alpha/beta fold hydrolase [Acidimicrobiales bacterium]
MSVRIPPHVQRMGLRSVRRLVFNPDVAWAKQRTRLRAAIMGTRPLFDVAVESVHVGGVACERMTPLRVERSRRIVYVHGGGYCVGSSDMGHGLCSYLAASFDAEVLCVNYRLAPEHPAPAAVDDVEAVLRSLEGRTVVALGDSAGAGALVAALQRGVHNVRSLVLVSPWLDLSVERQRDEQLVARDPLLSPEWLAACAAAYAGTDLSNPEVSPLLGSWDDLPATLVVGGGDDLLAPDARRVAALGLEHVRVREFPDFWHDFALSVGQLAVADETARLIALHFANATGWRARTLAQ